MNIRFKRLHENAVMPQYQTAQAAAMDVVACIDEPVIIASHERIIIPTGFAMALPDGYEAQIRARSGLAAKTRHYAGQWRGNDRCRLSW